MSAVVHIVDDDLSVRRSLVWLLESVQLPVRTHASASEFLSAYRPGSPGCLVLDVRMPDISGLDLQQRLHEAGITLPVIIVTGHADVPMAIRAMKCGAFDFIEKPYNDQVLLERIQAAIAHDTDAHRRKQQVAVIREHFKMLTERERDVLRFVVDGRTNKSIAAALGLSVKTIEVHRARLMVKMSAASLCDLVRMAVAIETEETG